MRARRQPMVGSDGRPQLSAIWFVDDAGTVRVSLNSARAKVRDLRRNPAMNLFILDRAAPTRYLEIRGDAELEDDPDYAFAQRVGAKYSADLRAYDGDKPHRVIATLHPVRVHAMDMGGRGLTRGDLTLAPGVAVPGGARRRCRSVPAPLSAGAGPGPRGRAGPTPRRRG